MKKKLQRVAVLSVGTLVWMWLFSLIAFAYYKCAGQIGWLTWERVVLQLVTAPVVFMAFVVWTRIYWAFLDSDILRELK